MKHFYSKFTKKTFRNLFLGISLLFASQGIQAATITSTAAGGDWNSTSTWVGGTVPANSTADYVIILGTATVTLNLTANIAVGALDINQGGKLNVSSDATTRSFTLGVLSPGSTIAGELFFDASVKGSKSFGKVLVTATGSIIETFPTSISLNNGATGNFTNYGTVTTGSLGTSTFAMYNYGIMTISGGFNSGSSPGNFYNYPGATFNYTGGAGCNIQNSGTLNINTYTGTNAASISNFSTGTLNFLNATTASAWSLTATEAGNTVNYSAAVNQTVKDVQYSNLILSNTGTKTVATAASGTLCTGTLTISDAAKASITNTNVSVGKLNLGGVGQSANNYGGQSSTATVKNATYFIGAGFLNVQSTLGIAQFSANDLKLYPNPAAGGNFTISLPSLQEESKVSILNAGGATVYTTKVAASENTNINLNTQLATGIYLVKMDQAGKSITKKLIIN